MRTARSTSMDAPPDLSRAIVDLAMTGKQGLELCWVKAMQEKRIYLDFNATTPIAPEVATAIDQVLTGPFGNPSSEHWAGLPARQAVEKARTQVAALLHCNSDEIVFTSGGSESNNHALKVFSSLRAGAAATSSPLRSNTRRFSTRAVFLSGS